MNGKILLGCVADDFTGGSDAASFLVAGGMRTVLVSGVPGDTLALPEGCEAVVIALKSRTQETAQAVADSLAAIRWLRTQGAQYFYIKYCSTFDSTPHGNIGPIVDAAMEELNAPYTILCPALPANERIVREGILYVKGVPLAESPMKNHPLTPMWASRIAELMAPQGQHPCLELSSVLLQNPAQAQQALAQFTEKHERFYGIPDYCTDADAEAIVRLFGGNVLLTGGSGILTAWARRLKQGTAGAARASGVPGRAILLAGSCSAATRAQTACYAQQGGTLLRLTDEGLLSGVQTAESVWRSVQGVQSTAPLIYASDTPEGLKAKSAETLHRVSYLVEQTLSGVAACAVADGVQRIIVAGGETSGAVTQALGWNAFEIGESIAPGVPILIPLSSPQVRLVLKSGNFGQEDFFVRALRMTGTENGGTSDGAA